MIDGQLPKMGNCPRCYFFKKFRKGRETQLNETKGTENNNSYKHSECRKERGKQNHCRGCRGVAVHFFGHNVGGNGGWGAMD